ncbi:MAG: HIT family protein [Proteobacteria bacterium]|nr:HIT family protein [Pseudomonadota bacterium]
MKNLIKTGTKILEFENWILYLHPNQCYLGRTYLWAKRHDAVDFVDMNSEEWKEFRKITPHIKQIIQKLFSPDMFNYASLGNIAPHLHVHIIPRYKNIHYFEGLAFNDKRWGKNYSPYNRKFSIPLKVHNTIAQLIEENIHDIF